MANAHGVFDALKKIKVRNFFAEAYAPVRSRAGKYGPFGRPQGALKRLTDI